MFVTFVTGGVVVVVVIVVELMGSLVHDVVEFDVDVDAAAVDVRDDGEIVDADKTMLDVAKYSLGSLVNFDYYYYLTAVVFVVVVVVDSDYYCCLNY